MNNPCLDCDKRYVGCHAKCSDYISWKAKHDIIMENERKRKGDNYFFDRNAKRLEYNKRQQQKYAKRFW